MLLENGKSSNTDCVVECNGNHDKTRKIEGVKPVWKQILKPFPIKCDKIENLKPIHVKIEHDPGIMSVCKFIGDVIISDLGAIFAKPGQWAIKQDYVLGDSEK